ncbi:zinc finger in N-recognin (macronuclear) [Tetrahymena thermophila SB210]|uniref:E3 ubiquitin-protein ligase n=1 Tax=Tetrahymena thermophila (strain SB210) TaxID=312017 RepID=I7M7U8_TETTS|nr:zinc finger in N-recognin [Tetrahymena thermophila SB210]EAR96041.2 zinc finger in N-recognin [Tetrahymena thermophila SB210]|eukprot:XP_001016286.2 zinc finger in N-recognin [Tetrahymena thermophila SB210]
MKLKFDKLFSLAIQIDNPNGSQDIKKFLSNKHQNSKQNSCNKVLSRGSTYYQCHECSPLIVQLKKEKKEIQNGQIYLSICEDCFEVQKHKGHHVQKFQVQNTEILYCYCGDHNICNQNSFCQNHTGYNHDQFKYVQQETQHFYEGIQRFFLEQFHIVFDKLSDLILSEEVQKTNQEDQYDKVISRVNFLLENILLKINEIIEVIPNSICFFPKLLKQSLLKPISLDIQEKNNLSSNWERQFNENKKVNAHISIYEYILLFYEHLTQENDILLGKLFGILLKVDDDFCLQANKGFFKYIEFTIRIVSNDQQNGINLVLPSFTDYLAKYICLQRVFNDLIDNLGIKILIPISVFTHFMQNIGNKNRSEFSKIILFPDQSIESLYLLSYTMFTVNSILLPNEMEQYKQENQKYILANILSTLFFKQLEKQLVSSFENVYKSLLLNDDIDLSNQTTSIIIKTYKKYTKKAIEFIDFISNKGVLFKSFSMSFVTHLPLMIALSERKVLDQNVLECFFIKFFNFGNNLSQTERDLTMKKTFRDLFVVMDKSFIMHSKPYLKQQMYFYISQLEQYNLEQANDVKSTLGFVEEFLYSPEYRVYDFYMLTYSLLLLSDKRSILDQQVNCFNLQFSQFENFKNQISNAITIFASQDCTDFVLQLILDGSVIINVFQNVYEDYFNLKENKDYQYEQNIKEVIVTGIQEIQQNKVFLKEILQNIQKTLSSNNNLASYISQVCEKDQALTIDQDNCQLVLLPCFYDKIFARHILRRNRSQIDRVITIQIDKIKNSVSEFCSVGCHFSMDGLYTYQKQLCKKVYLDLEYQKKLIDYHLIKQVVTFPTAILYKHVYVILNMFCKEQQNLANFSEEEIERIHLIINLFKDKQIYQVYNQKQLTDYLEQNKPSDLQRTYTFITTQFKAYLINKS